MAKIEVEVKILNIDEEAFKKQLEALGATLVEESIQHLYTYDLPTIYGRYIDILSQLNHPKNMVKYQSALDKLKLFFFELDNLITSNDKKKLKNIIGETTFSHILEKEELITILNSKKIKAFISKFHNNDNKWIRLRQTNNKVTLAVKHVLADDESGIQQLLETEMDIPSIKEGKELLEAMGLSHKSYQEKKRITYCFDNHSLDIDTWPSIPTYVEIEGEDKQDLENILNKLGYNITDTVSCTADDVYKLYGKTIPSNCRELKFDK